MSSCLPAAETTIPPVCMTLGIVAVAEGTTTCGCWLSPSRDGGVCGADEAGDVVSECDGLSGSDAGDTSPESGDGYMAWVLDGR